MFSSVHVKFMARLSVILLNVVIIKFPFITFCFCFETCLQKALEAALWERGLSVWTAAIINHLYWSLPFTLIEIYVLEAETVVDL